MVRTANLFGAIAFLSVVTSVAHAQQADEMEAPDDASIDDASQDDRGDDAIDGPDAPNDEVPSQSADDPTADPEVDAPEVDAPADPEETSADAAVTTSEPDAAAVLPSWLLDTLRVIRPTLLGEIDGRLYAREQEGESGFALGRFRFGLILEPTDWLRAVATAEWAAEAAFLLDGFVTLRPTEWLEIGVGYAKAPLFSSFRYEPVYSLPFPDRAPVVNAFRVRRDVGAEIHVMPREAPIEAIVRVGNGSGSILGNDIAVPAGYASADLVLGRAWTGSSPADRDWGLRLGAAGMVESVRDRDGVTGTAPLGFLYYRPAVVSGLRIVGEAHAIAYLGPLRLSFEGALADEARSRDDDGNPSTPRVALDSIRSSGMTFEVAWVALGGPRAVGRAPTVAEDRDGVWGGGALEIAARFDALWLGWSARDVTEGGALAGGASVRWWPVEFLTVTLAGHVTRYALAPIETPGELWSWDALLRLGVFWGQAAISS